MALLFVVASPGTGLAATLKSIDQDALNLRAGPSTTYKVISSLPSGQTVNVLDEQDGWFKIRTAAGVEAWAAGWVSRVNYSESELVYAIVNTDALNFRRTPSMFGDVLAVLKTNERVRVLEMAGEWWRVRRESKEEGWVNAQYMKREAAAKPTPPPAQPQQPAPPPAQPPVKPPEPAETPAPAAPASAVPVLAPLPQPAVRPAGPKVVKAAGNATVYLGRNAQAFDPVDRVTAGETLKYVDAAEGWVKVTTPRGKTGWIVGPSVALTEGKVAYQLKEGAWSLGYGAAAAPAPAPAPTPVTPPPAAPNPSSSHVEWRTVRDADGLNLRKEPNDLSTVITALPKGELLDVQGFNMPWLRVVTAAGQTGWVHVDYTDRYTGPAPAPAPATPAPAPATPAPTTPAPAASSTLKASLTMISGGALQLEITSTDKPLGEPRVEGNTLTIAVPTGETVTSALPIGSAGAKELALTPTGIALTMEAMPGMQVVQKSAAKIVLTLRSTVTAVSTVAAADRTIYAFRVDGPVQPRTRAAGDTVTVEFPGATSTVTAGALPVGLTLQNTAAGVQVAVASRLPYTLKRAAGGYELHLYQPGLAGKTIVLDPGHGGSDPGATNKNIGLRESDANLGIALRLRALLAAKGANVLMTRISDVRPVPNNVLAAGPQDDPLHVDLGYRSRIANELKADAFMSIHNNCCSGSGTEVYYTSTVLNGDRSRTLASLVQQELPKGLGQLNRGSFDDLMYVTRTNETPAVLVEVAFVSHSIEGPLLKRSVYQDQVAALLLKSFERFFATRTD